MYNIDKGDDEKIYPLQIKEKFGGLRVYTNFQDETLGKMIDAAEEESYKMCEECGSKEDVGMTIGGWYQTVCLNCVVKRASKQDRPILWKSRSDGKKYWVYGDGHKEEWTENLP